MATLHSARAHRNVAASSVPGAVSSRAVASHAPNGAFRRSDLTEWHELQRSSGGAVFRARLGAAGRLVALKRDLRGLQNQFNPKSAFSAPVICQKGARACVLAVGSAGRGGVLKSLRAVRTRPPRARPSCGTGGGAASRLASPPRGAASRQLRRRAAAADPRVRVCCGCVFTPLSLVRRKRLTTAGGKNSHPRRALAARPSLQP